jgi:POT family proton-dependent oligopeptide transporter
MAATSRYDDGSTVQHETLFGHPVGLYTLFFAEMWERFSFYGMRAILIFYMLKGFLKYDDRNSTAVYGAYTALVYMTPFFGGMIADRLLGPRRAVVLGGAFMAAGHLMMTVNNTNAFFTALALLIIGNGFFKPNISTMVSSLYPKGSPKRDGGFTIFYLGVNLGAAISPILCSIIGEKYGWHYGFGLATIGMLTGIAVFVAPSITSQIAIAFVDVIAALNMFVVPQFIEDESPLRSYLNWGVFACLIIAAVIALFLMGRERPTETWLSRLLLRLVIAITAILAAGALIWFSPSDVYVLAINGFVALALLVAAVIAWIALGRGGLPANTGAPPDVAALRQPILGIPAEWLTYLGAVAVVPVIALFVCGFAPFNGGKPYTVIPDSYIDSVKESGNFGKAASVVLKETSKPAGVVLLVAGLVALAYLVREMIKLDVIARHRMYVVLILTFFSMFFWAFFEQAGSSLNIFADRNVNRVVGQGRSIENSDIGSTIKIQPTQQQLGYSNGDRVFTADQLAALRETNKSNPDFTIDWTVAGDNVGMIVAGRDEEIAAGWFQSVNAVYILVFGLVFTAVWGFLGKRGLEPSTPYKFSLGLLQLGLGFAAFWYGAQTADNRGMVAMLWLFVGYLLHTTGELCLSPVGLSMVAKLSPAFLVSTVMGTWFLATAFSQFLAGIIAQFTSVESGDQAAGIPIPKETLKLFDSVYGKIAIAAIASAVVCFILSPLLTKWMHSDVADESNAPAPGPPSPETI